MATTVKRASGTIGLLASAILAWCAWVDVGTADLCYDLNPKHCEEFDPWGCPPFPDEETNQCPKHAFGYFLGDEIPRVKQVDSFLTNVDTFTEKTGQSHVEVILRTDFCMSRTAVKGDSGFPWFSRSAAEAIVNEERLL
jgi:hypothetical protein